MRRLFIVGAKLLGLVCLWWGIFATLQILSYSAMFFGNQAYQSPLIATLLNILGLIIYFVLAVCFAWILLFRTNWVADKVGLDKDDVLPSWPQEHKLLYLGIVLLGLYVLTHAIPGFAKSLFTLAGNFRNQRNSAFFIVPLFTNIIETILGVLLIIMPGRIIELIDKVQKKLGKNSNMPEQNIPKEEI
jgi:hypothetical protein